MAQVKKTIFTVAAIATVLCVHGKDLEFGGVTFRVPEKGVGVAVVENGKATRLFQTNLGYSDENGRRFLQIEWTKTNKVEKLDALPGRTAYRVTFPIKDTDALQFSAVYRFFDGIPGVAVTEEIVAIRPVRIHSWNMTTASGDDRLRFFYDPEFRIAEGTILYAPYRKRLSRTEGTLLEAGKSMTMTHVAGKVLAEGDAGKISRLRDRVLFDGRDGPVVVTRLDQDAGDAAPDWNAVPIAVERRDTRDYRPLASNQWKGPDDLSFSLKAAYDNAFLHLLIDVTDDIAVNRYENKTLYLGDAVQLCIDPLMERMNGDNHVDLLAAVAGSGPRLWCLTHSNRDFRGNVSSIIKNRSRLREGGIVYELSIPWKFLEPFKPENGSFTLSFAVIDQDSGPNYETWMGVTDGVFGGRDCEKYAEFALEGIADLSEDAVRGEVKLLHTREELLALHGRVSNLQSNLAAKCAALKDRGLEDDYLSAVSEMTAHFLAFERDDLDLEKVWKKSGEVPVTDVIRSFIYNRFHYNLTYLEKLVATLIPRADETLAGKRPPMRFAVYPKGERPRVADGGFKAGGRELFLYGPNTWVAGVPWKNRHGQIATMARTGFNLFNLFNASGALRTNLMHLAEREGIYCSFGSQSNAKFTLDEEAWSNYWAKADSNTWNNRAKFDYASSNMVFQVGFPEQFGQFFEKTPEWATGFQRHLLAKFGSLEGVNAELGTSFADVGEIDFSTALEHPALKYESMVYRLDMHIAHEVPHLEFKRRRFDNLPMSGHFSTHWNIAGLDPLVSLADFERIWGMFDVIGFDGGCGLGSSEFLINFASGCFEIDLARSFYPDKPIANNEDHIIPDGTYRHYTDEESYLANMLPFLLGQNAASYWIWQPCFHGDGEYAFTMANTYHASLCVAADLRRVPEEIASFRKTPDPPFRILHSVPSLTDRDSYVPSLYGLYAGSSFSGWAVRFLSERKADADDFSGARIVLVPDARRVSDATFAALRKFAEEGGRVVVFGKEALLANEHGRPRPERAAVCDSLFRRETTISTAAYAAVLEEELAKAGIQPPASVTDGNGKRPFGVLSREGRMADGRRTLLVVNLLAKPTEVTIAGSWRDTLGGNDVSGVTSLPTGGVLVLVDSSPDRR